MTPGIKQLLYIFLLLILPVFLVSCTDGRKPGYDPNVYVTKEAPPKTDMREIATISYDQGDMVVSQMLVKGGSLYLVGKPFYFMRYDISSNAEDPGIVFDISQQMNKFMSFPGAWRSDYYAQGALAVVGNTAFMSGGVQPSALGMSIVSLADTHNPREVNRIPEENKGDDPEKWVRDEAFLYSAIVAHPSLPIVYGFKQQDYVYTLSISDSVKLVSKASYGPPGSTTCCVQSATYWNGKVYVAFKSKLVIFNVSSNGNLSLNSEITKFQAHNVAATPKYLYVQHEPTYAQSSGSMNPKGIYVFDQSLRNVAHLTTKSPILFTVSWDDAYVFINNDNTKISINKIDWLR